MDEASEARRSWSWAGILLLYALLKIWMATSVELGKDEAAYVYWSRHLDATYGLLPLGAIALADRLLPGHEWALRLGFELCGIASIYLLYRLCHLAGLEPSLSRWVAAAFASSHWVWHTTSYLHPDGLLVTCWLLCLVWARQAAGDPRPVLWVKVGVAAGLALLCKLSAVFLVLGLFVWILATAPRSARWHRTVLVAVPFFLVTSPLIHAQLDTGLFLPHTLGTLSRIVADRDVWWRLAVFLLDPLLFVSPLLLWLLYRALAAGILQVVRRPGCADLLGVLPAVSLLLGFGFFALVNGRSRATGSCRPSWGCGRGPSAGPTSRGARRGSWVRWSSRGRSRRWSSA